MNNNVIDVLIDKAANNLSIIAKDDTTGAEVEHTLSVEDAWQLVVDLNATLTKLMPSIIQKGSVVAEVVRAGIQPFAAQPVLYTQPERVREAVLESIGADGVRPRHIPPGSAAELKKKGLRDPDAAIEEITHPVLKIRSSEPAPVFVPRDLIEGQS